MATIQKPQSVSTSKSRSPFVTIILPICNEALYIECCLNALLTQEYPEESMEIIIADGMSNDGTRQTIQQIANRQQNLSIQVIDNPKIIVSTGLNRAIKQAKGEVIIRVDGHTKVANDFVRQNVMLLQQHPEAWSVGGPLQHVGDTTFGQAVAIAMSHPIGIGNAMHHFANFKGYTEGAPFPAFRREVFSKVGYFDENFVRNEDDEFNYRIIQAGGKIFVSPVVKSVYFVRGSPKLLFKQYLQYGFWRIATLKKYKRPTTLRQIIPALFYISMTTLFLIGLLLKQLIIALCLPIIYGISLFIIGIYSSLKAGWAVAWRVPLAMGIIHAGYALGFLYGLPAFILQPDSICRNSHMGKLSR